MTDFTITKLKRVNGEWSKRDVRLIATFSVNLGGITIHGCPLLESRDGEFKADGPRGTNRKGWQISTHVYDTALQRAMTERAVEIYRQACRLPGGRYDRAGGGSEL